MRINHWTDSRDIAMVAKDEGKHSDIEGIGEAAMWMLIKHLCL